MEQPNMMPNGMNNLNMAMNSMQRPQSGNGGQQIHAMIMEHLRVNLPRLGPGWQQTFDIRERAGRIIQMVTQLRFLDSSMQKCINIAESWEQKTIAESPNKEYYMAQWVEKFADITRKRQNQAAQNGGLGIPQNNNMGNMHNMNMQQAGGMNPMNGMGGMNINMNNFNNMGGMGGMNMPNGGGMGMLNQMNMGQQAGFPQQLQRQMQPSPMPQQPQNGSIDPSALTQNPQQMQSHGQMNQPASQQRPQQANMNPNQGGQPNEPGDNEVKQLAMHMFSTMPDETKNRIRSQLISRMNDQARQAMHQRKHDPLHGYCIQNAREQLRKQRQHQNGGMGGDQQQNSNFDFSSMMGQQANAMKAQESGGEVVPASNNNNNKGNTMQQGGNNQQPMMNFNQNGGANPQMMQLAAMQERQKREQMAKKNQMAQQQALAQQAQQNQLRGQPGGLNAPNALNGGQVNSPAMNMNMLNRPMAPPGQATPSTPHQNQNQNQPPQTPSSGANQLAQHHQNMLSQNQNQNQLGQDGLHPQQRQFMSTLPPQAQEKLLAMAPAQRKALLERFYQQRGQQAGGQPMNQNMPGMGGQPLQNQQPMNAASMGNPMPAFNAQPNQQQSQMNSQQAQSQQPQNNQLKQKAMDIARYPRQVLASLSISVPDQIDTWGKLRQYTGQNQGILPQGLTNRLLAMQNQWFESHPEELKNAVESLKRMIMQRQQQAGAPGMQMPNGQAPPAQMVAPPAQMQQPQNQTQTQVPDSQFIPSEQIAMMRAKMPTMKNLTDDQIREMMRRRRATQNAQANQDMQQNLRNAQMNAQAQQRQQSMANGQQVEQQGGQRPQQAQQQGQGQKRGNSDDVVEIPNPNAPAVQQQQMQQNQQQRGMPPQMPNVAGLKTRDELAAMPKDQRDAYMRKMKELQALRQAQIGIGAATQQQQAQNAAQTQQPSTQQPQQQGQQLNGASPEMHQILLRMRQIYAEVQQSNPKGPEVQLDPRSLQTARDLLKKLFPIARTLDKTLIAAYRAFGEEKIREAIKIKQIIVQNAADEEGNIKDYLAVGLDTLKRSEQFIGLYMKELKAKQLAQQQQQGQGGQQAQASAQQQPKQELQAQAKQPTPAAAPKAQPPLNRKNSSQHARKASQNKVPPAPTENKSFDWASPTPHGVPKYDPGRTELTADKLKFPPQKKRKTTDSQSSTPAATSTPVPAGASPHNITGAPKRDSPEQIRKMPQQEPERPRFNCDDVFCTASVQGFNSEEELKKHQDEEHRAIDNPLQFLVDTVDKTLTTIGFDQQGQPLATAPKASAPAARRPPAAQKVADRKVAAASLTPALKAESATPATPASVGKPAVKPGLTTPAGKKTEETKVPDAEESLYDMLVEQTGIELPSFFESDKPPHTIEEQAKAIGEKDDQLFWLLLDGDSQEDGNDLDDWDKVDWDSLAPPFRDPAAALSDSDASSSLSPQLTPASSNSGSVNPAEISISEAQRLKMVFEWDPSGNGDTAVPEKLRQLALSEESIDAGAAEGEEGKQVKDPWNWDGDKYDWDSIFGA